MNGREKALLELSKKQLDEYSNCSWFKFKQRRKLFKKWQQTLDFLTIQTQ